MALNQKPVSTAEECSTTADDGVDYSLLQKILAWGVHLFTASGAVFCLLAMNAGAGQSWREAFAWLTLAVFIDAVDGFLARSARVKKVLPQFDGALLDNLIDYASYVLVPAFLLFRAELLPAAFSFWGAAAIVLASAYQFCQADAKTADHYFKGFPSYWNVTVLYLLALGLDPRANLAIVAVLIILVFVPIRYVYPSRTPQFQTWTLTLGALWALSVIAIVWQLLAPPQWLLGASLLYVAYYFGVSLYLTINREQCN